MTDNEIENEIKAKGLTAPRVTPADIEANIANSFYFTAKQGAEGAMRDSGNNSAGSPEDAAALGVLTFCVLILKNGFTVTGKSACASPENFDAELGRKIARKNAINQMYELMGYALKDRLWQESQQAKDACDNCEDCNCDKEVARLHGKDKVGL